MGLTGGGGGGGGKILRMKVLVPNSTGKEDSGEIPYTELDWKDLSPADREGYIKALGRPNDGISFQFDADEAQDLFNRGRFNIALGNYAKTLLGVTARSIVDTDEDIMVEFLGQFSQTGGHPIENNTRVSLVLPQKMEYILQDIGKPV